MLAYWRNPYFLNSRPLQYVLFWLQIEFDVSIFLYIVSAMHLFNVLNQILYYSIISSIIILF